jgi:hypothetical protein
MPFISNYIYKFHCFGTKPISTTSNSSQQNFTTKSKFSTMAPVVLILGSGPRVGASVAQEFKNSGYNVALASRKGIDGKTDDGYLSIKADFASPSSIPSVFSAVKSEFGSAPSVVVYNAAALTPPPDQASVLSVPTEAVIKDLNVNVVSPYVAAQQAVAAWDFLPQDTKKTFIYTGNAMNELIVPMPPMVDLGMGKSASAFWIGLADALYKAKGYR